MIIHSLSTQIPLARGTPVVVVHPHPRGVFTGLCLHHSGGTWAIHNGGSTSLHPEHQLRVNIAHRLGFAYALRWLRGQGSEHFNQVGAPWLLEKWVRGTTTEVDRDSLDAACAEVA